MTAHPDVSVLIATYNDARFLPDSVGSVLAQEYDGEIEVVIVDDGSEPAAAEVYQPDDARVRIERIAHGGVCRARNAGVEMCRGEFVLFLDSDDQMLPGRIAAQAGFLADYPEIALAGGDITRLDADGSKDTWGIFETGREALEARELDAGRYVFAASFPRFLLTHFPFVPSVMALRRSAWEFGVRFDESLIQWEDWDFTMRMARRASVGYVRRPMTLYRRHAASATANPHPRKFLSAAHVFAGWRRDFGDLSPAERAELRRREAHELLNASRAARARNRAQAMRHALRAVRVSPSVKTLKAVAGALVGPA